MYPAVVVFDKYFLCDMLRHASTMNTKSGGIGTRGYSADSLVYTQSVTAIVNDAISNIIYAWCKAYIKLYHA